MSSSEEIIEEEVKVVLDVHSIPSTPDPPMADWSSILLEPIQENEKRVLYEQGLYDPGTGEICAMYIAQSDSSVFRHPYYKYPAIADPGIQRALQAEEPGVFYEIDGKDLYLAICKEMKQCPVRLFYEQLVQNEIDLSYYCVNPWGVRAMTIALEANPYVCVLNLTENFLNDDACFHLGDLLTKNRTLEELNLSGCKIGVSGLRRLLNGLLKNRSLLSLNLNSNDLTDEGAALIANAFENGLSVTDIYLSYNSFGPSAALDLAQGLEFYDTLKKLDLSWNSLCSPNDVKGICALLRHLEHNEDLELLDLSWNAISGVKIATAMKKILLLKKLAFLNLSNNKIDDHFIQTMIFNLSKSRKLATLDFSNNPITSVGARKILTRLRFKGAGVNDLILNNIPVDDDFMTELTEVKNLKFRSDFKVTTGIHTKTFMPEGPDMRNLLMNRVKAICLKPKRKSKRVNFALFMLQLAKDTELSNMHAKSLETSFKTVGAAIDKDLCAQLCAAFPGPIIAKERTLDLVKLVDYIHRMWPEEKLPPTPPPEPEPEPLPPVKKKKGKGKEKATPSKKVERGGGDAPPKKQGKDKVKK